MQNMISTLKSKINQLNKHEIDTVCGSWCSCFCSSPGGQAQIYGDQQEIEQCIDYCKHQRLIYNKCVPVGLIGEFIRNCGTILYDASSWG